MKILIAGDLHFEKPQFKWLETQKKHYDCFCLTGDFLDERLNGFTQQTDWVTHWIETLDKEIFICSGNHDLDDFGECEWLRNIKNPKVCTDNQKRVFQGIKFGCVPYLGSNLSNFHDCDILLTHVPPFKTATSIDDVTQRDWGDKEVYSAIKSGNISPRYIFCGHVDKPVRRRDQIFGVEIVNPGSHHHTSIPQHEIISILP